MSALPRSTSPRFLLILSADSNLLLALLVTRELRIVASAQQSFQIAVQPDEQQTFDPAEVWYKTKKVVGACLDIGRTLPREIAGLVILTGQTQKIEWREREVHIGTMAEWLYWSLTGEYLAAGTREYGKTRARTPFDAELPIIAVWGADETSDHSHHARELNSITSDRQVLDAARQAWERVPS